MPGLTECYVVVLTHIWWHLMRFHCCRGFFAARNQVKYVEPEIDKLCCVWVFARVAEYYIFLAKCNLIKIVHKCLFRICTRIVHRQPPISFYFHIQIYYYSERHLEWHMAVIYDFERSIRKSFCPWFSFHRTQSFNEANSFRGFLSSSALALSLSLRCAMNWTENLWLIEEALQWITNEESVILLPAEQNINLNVVDRIFFPWNNVSSYPWANSISILSFSKKVFQPGWSSHTSIVGFNSPLLLSRAVWAIGKVFFFEVMKWSFLFNFLRF